jgi:hypothetical protein
MARIGPRGSEPAQARRRPGSARRTGAGNAQAAAQRGLAGPGGRARRVDSGSARAGVAGGGQQRRAARGCGSQALARARGSGTRRPELTHGDERSRNVQSACGQQACAAWRWRAGTVPGGGVGGLCRR